MAEIAQPTNVTNEQWNTVKRASRFMATYVRDADCTALAKLKGDGNRTTIALLDWHVDALSNITKDQPETDLTGDDRLQAMESLFHMLSECAAETQTVDWIYSAYCFFFYLERFARNGRTSFTRETATKR